MLTHNTLTRQRDIRTVALVMKQHAINALATSALLLGASSGFAGEPAPYIPAPAPAPECGSPGWTVTAAALYLKSYGSGSGLIGDSFLENEVGYSAGGYDGDFDWGFRGSIGYERPDGLFFRLVGFWWEGDYSRENSSFDEFDSEDLSNYKNEGKIKAYSFDLLIGDTFCPTENTSVEISAGLRYAKLEQDQKISGRENFGEGEFLDGSLARDYEFDGWGPTIQIRGRRALTDRWGLYADFQQSFLFGEGDFSNTEFREEFDGDDPFSGDLDDKRSSDTIAAISEIRGGIEYLWGWNQIQNAYVRLGAEGQYWWIDSEDIGLVGGHLEVGFTF